MILKHRNVVKYYQNIRYVKPNGEPVIKQKIEKPQQNCKGIDAHDRFFEKKYINIPHHFYKMTKPPPLPPLIINYQYFGGHK